MLFRSLALFSAQDAREALVAPLLGGERGKAPVVEDQQLGARQTLEELCIAPITAGERERIEQPGQAMVEDRAVVAAGLVAERASNSTFADSGRADDEQVRAACRESHYGRRWQICRSRRQERCDFR